MLGFTVNIDFLGIHIHEYVHLPGLFALLWSIIWGLVVYWIRSRVVHAWDGWYDKHPLSHIIFHHHLKGHPAEAAWLCTVDGCQQVTLDERDNTPAR